MTRNKTVSACEHDYELIGLEEDKFISGETQKLNGFKLVNWLICVAIDFQKFCFPTSNKDRIISQGHLLLNEIGK